MWAMVDLPFTPPHWYLFVPSFILVLFLSYFTFSYNLLITLVINSPLLFSISLFSPLFLYIDLMIISSHSSGILFCLSIFLLIVLLCYCLHLLHFLSICYSIFVYHLVQDFRLVELDQVMNYDVWSPNMLKIKAVKVLAWVNKLKKPM